jgi:hypothetical protein
MMGATSGKRLLQKQKETIGFQAGAWGRKGGGTRGSHKEPQPDAPPTLRDADIPKKLPAGAQQLAAISEKAFEEDLAKMKLPTVTRARRMARDHLATAPPGARANTKL